MMPAPGRQNPMPYLPATLCRKSYTSLLELRAAGRSLSAPASAWIRWSQCTDEGTAAVARPAFMNCSSAIWAVASCMATRSGAKFT